MLCCFGRTADGQKPVSPMQTVLPPASVAKVINEDATSLSHDVALPKPSADQKPKQQAATDSGSCFDEEPWRVRLSNRLVTLVSDLGLRAAR
jgi:hypothetical protein